MIKSVILIALFSISFAQEKLIIDDITQEDLQIKYLKINNEQNVNIQIISPEYFENTNSTAYAWIINSRTRELVWEMNEAKHSSFNRDLIEYTDEASFKKGVYEVHFASYMNRNFNGNVEVNGLKEFIKFFTRGFKNKRLKSRDLKEMKLELTYKDGETLTKSEASKYQFDENENAVYSFIRATDEEFEKFGFELTDDLEIHIYAFGEIFRDNEVDFAMIKNLETGETIWKMDYYNTEYAGGGKKNRAFNEKIKFDEGKYVLYYITDNSHSYGDWNSGSNYDPNFYGITLFVDKDDENDFKATGKTEIIYKNQIVDLTRLRDNEYVKQAFKLNKDMKLRIYALGEGRGNMADYSWIINMKTGKKIWEFDHHNSQHAGGDDKNRMIDEVIKFEKGEYVVYAKTDDSHSYRDWNSDKPHDREKWGISIFAVGDDVDEDDYNSFNINDRRNILAKIIQVRDDEKIKEKFEIKEKTTIHIYAIGEGSGGDMLDYGWIKDEDGSTIWKMRYRNTNHAGGARKNRMYEGTIELEPGIYYLYYRSDDSHSYGDFNSDEPMDRENWGITLYTLKD